MNPDKANGPLRADTAALHPCASALKLVPLLAVLMAVPPLVLLWYQVPSPFAKRTATPDAARLSLNVIPDPTTPRQEPGGAVGNQTPKGAGEPAATSPPTDDRLAEKFSGGSRDAEQTRKGRKDQQRQRPEGRGGSNPKTCRNAPGAAVSGPSSALAVNDAPKVYDEGWQISERVMLGQDGHHSQQHMTLQQSVIANQSRFMTTPAVRGQPPFAQKAP